MNYIFDDLRNGLVLRVGRRTEGTAKTSMQSIIK